MELERDHFAIVDSIPGAVIEKIKDIAETLFLTATKGKTKNPRIKLNGDAFTNTKFA